MQEVVDALWLASGITSPYTVEPDEDDFFGLDVDQHLINILRGVEVIVCEDWSIYPWEAEKGALNWDKCRTARAIGKLELIAKITNRQIVLQPASIKETAMSVGAGDFFVSPKYENRHENDSIMHAVYYERVGLKLESGAGTESN